MNLKIDLSSGLPIYLQLIEQIKHYIAIGVLNSEDQLPSVRKLSADLRINPNTIAKAFNIMENEGIVYTRRGEGTFISAGANEGAKESKMDILKSQIEQMVNTANMLNIQKEQVQKMIDEFYKDKRNE